MIYEAKGHVPCLGTIEALYLSVFNFEDRTLKTIEFCVGLYKLIFFLKCYNGYLSVITDIYPL
jgi:hypothetical protein